MIYARPCVCYARFPLTRIFVKSPEFVMPAHQGGREAGAEPGPNTLQHRTEDATQT